MTTPDQPFGPPDRGANPQPPENLPVDYPGYPDFPSSYPPPPPYQGYPHAPQHQGYPPPPPYQGYPPPYPGAPGGPPPYNPYQLGAPQGTNGMAIASLACSLGGLFCGVLSIVGLILGFLAMQQTKQTGQNGYGLALAGVITGAAMLAIWVISVIALTAH